MEERSYPSQATVSGFRVLGILTILFGLVCAFLWFINMQARKNGGHDLSGFVLFAVYFIPVGIGVLFLRRIFIILLALPTLAIAVWLFIGSITAVPFPWILINFAFASALCIPTYLIVKSWKEIK